MGTLQIEHMGSSAGSQTSIPSLKNIEHAGKRRLGLGGNRRPYWECPSVLHADEVTCL